jgi:hypothetical protein
VTPEAGLRKVLVARQDQVFVVGPLNAHREQLRNPIDAQIVETILVHLVECAGIPDCEHLSGRGKLAEVGNDWISQLEAGVSKRDADRGTTRGFNQFSSLIAGSRKVHRADPLVDNSAQVASSKSIAADHIRFSS